MASNNKRDIAAAVESQGSSVDSVQSPDSKKPKAPMINWSYNKENFLLIFVEKQLQESASEKGLKASDWQKVVSQMKTKYRDDDFTTAKCLNKYNNLKAEYAAYKMVVEASGLGPDSDNSVWDALVTKNQLVNKYRNGTVFRHYEKMCDIVGNNLFTGNDMRTAAELAEKGDPEPESTTSSRPVPPVAEKENITKNNNRGVRSPNNQIQAANILSAGLSEFSKEFGKGIASIAQALAPDAASDVVGTSAMQYFQGDGLLVDLMTDRYTRNMIMTFLQSEENAKFFLRCADEFKREFVEDNILN